MDLVNALFEAAGGLFMPLSIRKLYSEKLVRGVSWIAVAFFTIWGLWNVFYYPHLEQYLSFVAGLWLCGVTLIYLTMLIYYSLYEPFDFCEGDRIYSDVEEGERHYS
jgi:hypothetical protein